MTTYKLIIEYDGADFAGWQVQPEQRTVQGALEKALATVLRHPVPLTGASRTDAGVHALGQTASFSTDRELDLGRIVRSLGGLAGPDVAVVDAAGARDRFNARHDATGKHYRYQIVSGSAPSPTRRRMSLFVPRHLDLDRMNTAAGALIGYHDFAGFRAADCERENTQRTLTRVLVTDRPDGGVVIDVKGDGFLKNMVRIIAGTLIDIGRGHLEPTRIEEVLASGDRTRAGVTAPAHGLTLVSVFYES